MNFADKVFLGIIEFYQFLRCSISDRIRDDINDFCTIQVKRLCVIILRNSIRWVSFKEMNITCSF